MHPLEALLSPLRAATRGRANLSVVGGKEEPAAGDRGGEGSGVDGIARNSGTSTENNHLVGSATLREQLVAHVHVLLPRRCRVASAIQLPANSWRTRPEAAGNVVPPAGKPSTSKNGFAPHPLRDQTGQMPPVT